MAWGYHLLLDCKQGNLENISCKDNVTAFVKQLVNDIDMKAYGDLQIERFATHDPNKAGISFCQMIETSNITGHFVDLNGDFYIDVFSCKSYDSNTVLRLVQKYFNPANISMKFVERGKDATALSSKLIQPLF